MTNRLFLFRFSILALIPLLLWSCGKDPVADTPDTAPTAQFNPVYSGAVIAGCTPVSFTNLSEDATSYTWLFGAEGTSSENAPTFVFLVPGEIQIVLIAKNALGADTATATITVYPNSTSLPSLWKTIGATESLSIARALELPGGDMLAAGAESIQGTDFMYIARFDRDGKLVWKNTSEQDQPGSIHFLLSLEDGGCLIGGEKPYVAYVARLDAEGKRIWNKELSLGKMGGMQLLPDGQLAIFCADKRYRIGLDGQITAEFYQPTVHFQLADGSFFSTSYRAPSFGPSGTVSPAYMVKYISEQGKVLWEKILDYSYVHPCASQLLKNGELVVALSVGNTNPPNSNIRILRFDADGNELSSNEWDGGQDEWPVAIQQLPDSELLIAANAKSGQTVYPTLLRVGASGGVLGASAGVNPGEIVGMSVSADACASDNVLLSGFVGMEGLVWRTDKFGN